MRKTILFSCLLIMTPGWMIAQLTDALKWKKYELVFTSSSVYENPVQDLKMMEVTFTSPSGVIKTINTFWDGDNVWKARFMPDETGTWTFETRCSDIKNQGLHGQSGKLILGLMRAGKILQTWSGNKSSGYLLPHSFRWKIILLHGMHGLERSIEVNKRKWDQYLQQRASK